MAYTKIIKVKSNLNLCLDYTSNPMKTERRSAEDLNKLLNYTQNNDKTEHQLYVSGFNCIPQNAYEIMMETKTRWRKPVKDGNILAYHIIQSFAPSEAKESAEVQIQQLARQRKVLYRQKREPERAAREEKIKSLTQQMKALRHEVYICSDIETDAAEVQEKLRQAELAAQEERNEVKQDEQRRRSSRSDGAGSLTGYRGGY